MSTNKKAPTAFKRFVEVGRIVLITKGEFEGKLAAVVEIIDHSHVRLAFANAKLIRTQVLIDGTPNGVKRQSFALRNVTLTPLVIAKLPRGIGQGALVKAWEKAEVSSKWEQSAWAKKRAAVLRRRSLSDFERFQTALLRKQRRIAIAKGPSYMLLGSLTRAEAPKKKAA